MFRSIRIFSFGTSAKVAYQPLKHARNNYPSTARYFQSATIMESPKYSKGQTVQYKPVGGPDSNTAVSTGKIERVITEHAQAGSTGVTVKASEDDPRYEIKNDNTGKTSAVKEGNILGTVP